MWTSASSSDGAELPLSDLTALVLELVDTVPPGRVVSYGDVAGPAGTGPRQVGRIMADYGHLTQWWRVVRADGTSAVAERAARHWDDEGIRHRGGRVDMRACRWEGIGE